jgi:membrane-bound metal-dependent hydrolase YbcI (DUF457 family)
MTVYEHFMLGGSLALASGLEPRYGWRIIGMAAIASALPDWDGLSILFGSAAYVRAHRVWGHNLLVATATGGITGLLGFAYQRYQARTPAATAPGMPAAPVDELAPRRPPFLHAALFVWMATGALASLSHLAVDCVYSWHPGMQPWALPLFWPFSDKSWVFPIVPYGDLGATLIFIGEMFAIYRWPGRARGLASIALVLVALYVGVRWLAGSGPS